MTDGAPYDYDSDPGHGGGAARSREQREREAYNGFALRRRAAVLNLKMNSSKVDVMRASCANFKQRTYQELVDVAGPCPCCAHLDPDPARQPHVITTHLITVQDVDVFFGLRLPEFLCLNCAKSWVPQATEFGCFGASPAQPELWIAIQLLELYTFHQSSGLSVAGARGALALSGFDARAPPAATKASAGVTGGRMSDVQLRAAHTEYIMCVCSAVCLPKGFLITVAM